MASPEEALATQRRNIEARIGASVDEVRVAVESSGKLKHGEVRSWLIERYGLGYGDANSLAHFTMGGKAVGPSAGEDPLTTLYADKKAHLRPVHNAVIAAIEPWGEFEQSPKKAYVALRRKKQFAMIGPKSAQRIELGINLKDDIASERIVAQKPGGMCQYAVALSTPDDIDEEVVTALRKAFDAAG